MFNDRYQLTRKIFNENKQFFLLPITNQESFVAVFSSDKENMKCLEDYSKKLTDLLKDSRLNLNQRETLYDRWLKKDFKPSFEDVNIQDFIIKNKSHAAMQIWRQHRLDETNFFNQVNELSKKTNDLPKKNHKGEDDPARILERLQDLGLQYITGELYQSDFSKAIKVLQTKANQVCMPENNDESTKNSSAFSRAMQP